MKSDLTNTALLEADDAPEMDEWGYPTTTPEFDEEQMLEATEDPDPADSYAELPLEEAKALMEFAAPPDQDEIDLLDEAPFLDRHMMNVDDPDHTEWLIEKSTQDNHAMDEAMSDQMYGGSMMTPEEKMERTGSDGGFIQGEFIDGEFVQGEEFIQSGDDLGFSLKRLARKGLTTYNPAYQAARYTGKGIKAVGKVLTYPQRRLIRKFKNKLSGRRARTLAWQNRKSTEPTDQEKQEARTWANDWLRHKGGKFGPLLSKLGSDKFVQGDVLGTFVDGCCGPNHMGSFVGIEPVTAALLGMSIPALAMILSSLLKKASSSGAPQNPEGAPEGAQVEQDPGQGAPEGGAPEEGASDESGRWWNPTTWFRRTPPTSAKISTSIAKLVAVDNAFKTNAKQANALNSKGVKPDPRFVELCKQWLAFKAQLTRDLRKPATETKIHDFNRQRRDLYMTSIKPHFDRLTPAPKARPASDQRVSGNSIADDILGRWRGRPSPQARGRGRGRAVLLIMDESMDDRDIRNRKI